MDTGSLISTLKHYPKNSEILIETLEGLLVDFQVFTKGSNTDNPQPILKIRNPEGQ